MTSSFIEIPHVQDIKVNRGSEIENDHLLLLIKSKLEEDKNKKVERRKVENRKIKWYQRKNIEFKKQFQNNVEEYFKNKPSTKERKANGKILNTLY